MAESSKNRTVRSGCSAPVLDVRNVCFRRGRREILRDVSWSVARGQHWCILGPNGCGKTTLLNVITGYDSPTAGSVAVSGSLHGECDWREVRKKIGLVTSVLGIMLEDSEPVPEVVASGRDAKLNLIERVPPEVRRRALKLLAEVGCGHLCDSRWGVLSQGERQKVLICRSLMADFDVLILDEPCAGLDPVAREHFLAWMQRLARRKNAPSLVMVTHHVEEILPCMSHVLMLKDGAVFASGKKKRTLASRSLAALYGAPLRLVQTAGRYQMRLVR